MCVNFCILSHIPALRPHPPLFKSPSCYPFNHFSSLPSGKNLSYPLDHLCQVLRFSSEDEAISLLSSLGVKTVDNRVIFVKSGANSGGGAGGSHHRNSAAMTEELDQAPKNKQFRFVDQLILRFPHFPLKS